ncbi:SagB family peptide dehydrogenase [Streptomyces chartreusis]|uniref:SagB family peptide dehydrogenase n=1 Tax=Streptomyces chartreusis TaxID=1969 RepID=UPI0036BA62C0
MGYAHDYAGAIMRRSRVGMEPVSFIPNWHDAPRKSKYYPGVDALPLPDGGYPPDATLDRGLALPAVAQSPDAEERFNLTTLAGMLLDSYGLTGRRLGVQANSDLSALPSYPLANWSRGTASGGGLYPVSIYWVSGPSAAVPPGVHYYATRHHAMQRLLTGDVTSEVRAALGERAPGPSVTDQYLVLGVKHWQNAFKYNSFSFHVVCMDLGAVVQTWRMWARARGLTVEPALWFDEERLARLLGVHTQEEGIFAVIPLAWDGATGCGQAPATMTAPTGSRPAVHHRDVERSRRVFTFEPVSKMQAVTSVDAKARPAPGALAPAAAPPLRGGERIPLPAAKPLDTDVRTALRRRRSSFGRFDARSPLTRVQLATSLAAAAGAQLGGDCYGRNDPRLVSLYAVVNHVEELAPGAYRYDPDDHALRLVKKDVMGTFLQKNYFLANYNLEQAGVVLVSAIRIAAVLDAVGDRGYRLVNATVGAIAQTLYTASSAMELGCGVALGFDNISYIEELGLDDTGEAPLLIMMIGNERPDPADFRHEIA